MKTPTRLILMASIGSTLALAQEAERNNPPPAPGAPPARAEERPLGGERNRPERDEAGTDRRPDAERPRPDADRPRAEGERARRDAEGRARGEAERRDVARPQVERERPTGARGAGEGGVRPNARPMGPLDGPAGTRRDLFTLLPEKPQPYLGIVTRDAGADLAAQLRQPEGFGLVVEEVLPDSPAKNAGLERNDLLVRFDDQLLVNPPQLEALVRRAGKDKEATLTILRGGAEQKITIRIGEKVLPERRAFPGLRGNLFPPQMLPGGQPDAGPRRQPLRSGAEAGTREGSDREVRYARSHARVVRSDEHGQFELLSVDGTRTFIAQKPDGTVAWKGAVETPAQRDAVPAEWRKKLEMLEQGLAGNQPPNPNLPATRR